MWKNSARIGIPLLLLYGTAQASTVRIGCVDAAEGAQVSINGKFKGECPIDVTIPAGTISIKATKSIDGKPAVFEQKIRIGDDVVKRVEIIFGSPAGAGSPAAAPLQIDPHSVAQQRYEAEMAEYQARVRACLPRHAQEKGRLKQVLDQAYRAGWNECVTRKADQIQGNAESYEFWAVKLCGAEDPDNARDSTKERYAGSDYRAYLFFPDNAQQWCESQFTAPVAP